MQGWLPPEIARSRWRPTAAEKKQLKKEAQHWRSVRKIESLYGAQLRRIARMVADIVSHFPMGDPASADLLAAALQQYADSLEPWARAVAARMLAEVARRDATAWFRTAQEIGRALHQEIQSAPIGTEMARILDDQVHLITSIPIEAGRRVQEMTREHVASGQRYEDIAKKIRETHGITRNRATLIARTEVGKAATALVQARALHIGADSYIWRSAQDADVRRMHRILNGTVQKWADPPIAEEQGQKHHPGEFPNCRCFAEPVISDLIE